MLNSLIDLNLPSKISLERREELNRLAILAGKLRHADSFDISMADVNDLRCDCYTQLDIYNEIVGLGDSVNFYSDINVVFERTIEKDPSLFKTYCQLTDMFRALEKHQDFIYTKMSDAQMILNDLEVIEVEGFKR